MKVVSQDSHVLWLDILGCWWRSRLVPLGRVATGHMVSGEIRVR